MVSDSSIVGMEVVNIYHTVHSDDKINVYLKECHVSAIIAVVLVVVCIVDKGTVFLWYTITCVNTSKMISGVMKERPEEHKQYIRICLLHIIMKTTVKILAIMAGKMNSQVNQKRIQDIVRLHSINYCTMRFLQFSIRTKKIRFVYFFNIVPIPLAQLIRPTKLIKMTTELKKVLIHFLTRVRQLKMQV